MGDDPTLPELLGTLADDHGVSDDRIDQLLADTEAVLREIGADYEVPIDDAAVAAVQRALCAMAVEQVTDATTPLTIDHLADELATGGPRARSDVTFAVSAATRYDLETDALHRLSAGMVAENHRRGPDGGETDG